MIPADSHFEDREQDLPSQGMGIIGARSTRPGKFRRRLLRVAYGILTVVWVILTLDLLWPAISTFSNSQTNQKLTVPGGIDYLVIAPQALEKSASAWAEYRKSTGYHPQVTLLSPGQAKVEHIRDLIQKTYVISGRPYPFYVLLLGHAHPFSTSPNTFLPAAHFSVDQTRSSSFGTDPIASDDGYISLNPGGVPDHIQPIFIGRVPARTEAEGLLLLKRTREYEEIPPIGEGRARVELISSNANFGPQYDPIFEWALKTLIQKILPNDFQWHRINGNSNSPYSYPIDAFPKEIAHRFNTGSLAIVYIGHGQPDMLCCADSPNGEVGRIFNVEDANLIKNANSSLGIFTACSAGTYDLDGDDLSVVESIYLAPSGPVATYSSSAWINGGLNGRLVIDIFEGLLVGKPSTLGEWVGRIETWSESTVPSQLVTAAVKVIIPRLSKVYNNKLFFSQSQAHLELDIQHATYNLFGDPALRIAYAKPGMAISPTRTWQPWKGGVTFSGKTVFPSGQQVSISLEKIPGYAISTENQPIGTVDRYLLANNLIIGNMNLYSDNGGNFSGMMNIPPDTPDGKYLLKAVTVVNDATYVASHPVYIGWSSIREIFSSATFWWSVISSLLLIVIIGTVRQH